MTAPPDLYRLLQQHQQEHLLRFWDRLSGEEQRRFEQQLRQIDLPLIQRLIAGDDKASSGPSPGLAHRAAPPQDLVRLPETDADRRQRREAYLQGEELLRLGKVGAILVAGGQGTRLGFDQPKGTFPIGPVSDRTLFQVFCEQLLARGRRAGRRIPYFIMTSEATHEPTVAFFEEHKFFGMNPDDVVFFQQSSLPAVSDRDGKILLESPGRVATSPDGHGGLLRALQRHGVMDLLRERGVEHLYYHQVDNPTAIVCDPELLGLHLQQQSEMTTKVVAKTHPEEKMGVLVTIDGQTQIIEYSDLSAEDVQRRDEAGQYIFWAGNTAIHVFARTLLERLTSGGAELPFHVAHKKVATIDEQGNSVDPAQPNAHKFEQFIFDALPQAQRALVVEASRSREFNPVKNAEGADSPATSRAALNALARDWVEAAGGKVAEGVSIEISPLYANDAGELRSRLPENSSFHRNTVLT